MGSSQRELDSRNGPSTVHLSCGCEVLLKAPYPKIRDIQFCRRCSNYFAVVAVSGSWSVSCSSCVHFNRRYGSDKDAARRAASRHVLRFPRHLVTLSSPDAANEIVRNDGAEDELPFATVVADRRTMVKKHQAVLRDFLDNRSRPASVTTNNDNGGHNERQA